MSSTRQRRDAVDQRSQELLARAVDPVQVLDHEHLGSPLGGADQQPPQRLEGLATPLDGAHRPHVGVARVDGQQRPQVGRGLPRGRAASATPRSILAAIAASSSASSMPTCRRSRSTSGWKAIALPKDRQCPSCQAAAPPMRWRSSRSSRDLPMPGSPTRKRDLPLTGAGAFEGVEEQAELALAADERCEPPVGLDFEARARLVGADDLPARDGLRLALQGRSPSARVSK